MYIVQIVGHILYFRDFLHLRHVHCALYAFRVMFRHLYWMLFPRICKQMAFGKHLCYCY